MVKWEDFVLYTVVYFSVIGISFVRVSAVDFNIEAEEMSIEGSNLITRFNASGNRSVLLYQGDILKYELCLMETTAIRLTNLTYSNDGKSDVIKVTIDHTVLATLNTVTLVDGGRGWDRFSNPRTQFADKSVLEGRHILSITVEHADQFGVEIDYISIHLNTSQTQESLKCDVFCFDDVNYNVDVNLPTDVDMAVALQSSTPTICAEVDNVHIPVFHAHARKFTVTARLPKYTTFLNNRGPDWTNCKMAEAFWQFYGVRLSGGRTISNRGAVMRIDSHPGFGLVSSQKIGALEIDFSLTGPANGTIDSDIGIMVILKRVRFNGTLTLSFEYFDRFDHWVGPQSTTIKDYSNEIVFNVPDFSFREGDGNAVKITLYSDHHDSNSFYVDEISMTRRYLKGDASKKIYDDGTTVLEVVDIDMWWRINETMTVTVSGTEQTFNDVDYIRVYRRVPWSNNGFSQVFVMYQDGNIRLLPLTPHGLDWIPFGSSVIIGQTDSSDLRPSAPIIHLHINPNTLNLVIYYQDASVVSLQIVASLQETKLVISNSTFANDLLAYPFFTFRSMYVSDGNSDVDHIAVDKGQDYGILAPWGSIYGNFFAFYRKCISKHNTLSPDIVLEVTQ